MITREGYDKFISESQEEHKAGFEAMMAKTMKGNNKMTISELKLKYKLLVKVGEIKEATRVYNEIYELEKEGNNKMTFKTRYIDEPNSHCKIEIIVPRHEMTLEEAKQLLDSLTAEVEIAEWNERTITKDNHWSENYLDSICDDGLSVD